MIPKQLRQLPTPGRTGPTRLAPGATASWLRREAHVTVLVTPSGLPFAHGNRLKGSDVCQAGGSLVPACSASRGRRGTGWNFRCDGRRCRAKPAWGWSPTGKGSEPHSQAAEGEAARHRPRRPPSEATYQARAGGGTGRCLCPAATSLVPFSQLSHTALPARPGPRYTRGNGGRLVGSPPGHTRKRVP